MLAFFKIYLLFCPFQTVAVLRLLVQTFIVTSICSHPCFPKELCLFSDSLEVRVQIITSMTAVMQLIGRSEVSWFSFNLLIHILLILF